MLLNNNHLDEKRPQPREVPHPRQGVYRRVVGEWWKGRRMLYKWTNITLLFQSPPLVHTPDTVDAPPSPPSGQVRGSSGKSFQDAHVLGFP
jgi:hypothetical protein